MEPEEQAELETSDSEVPIEVDPDPEESTTQALLRGIAARQGVAETDLDPLFEHVEVDALEALVQRANELNNPTSVRFPVDGQVVCVRADDGIRIVGE